MKAFFKQYGWYSPARIVKAILRKLGLIYESFYLVKYKINSDDINAKISKFEISDVKELNYQDFKNNEAISAKKKTLFKERLESGDYSCFGIFNESKVVYYTWISWKMMGYPEIFNLKEELMPHQALLEDSFCFPDHRGKGYHSKMNLFRLKKIVESGKQEALGLVLKENRPALKVQKRSGFHIAQKISIFKFLNSSHIKRVAINDND